MLGLQVRSRSATLVPPQGPAAPSLAAPPALRRGCQACPDLQTLRLAHRESLNFGEWSREIHLRGAVALECNQRPVGRAGGTKLCLPATFEELNLLIINNGRAQVNFTKGFQDSKRFRDDVLA